MYNPYSCKCYDLFFWSKNTFQSQWKDLIFNLKIQSTSFIKFITNIDPFKTWIIFLNLR